MPINPDSIDFHEGDFQAIQEYLRTIAKDVNEVADAVNNLQVEMTALNDEVEKVARDNPASSD